MADAAYVAAMNFSVQQIARIFRVPSKKIGDDSARRSQIPIRGRESGPFAVLPPALDRPYRAGARQGRRPFPDKKLSPAFVVENLLRADIGTRYEAYLKPDRPAGSPRRDSGVGGRAADRGRR